MKVAYLFSRYPVPSQTLCDTEMRALEAAGFELEIYACSPPTTSFRHGVDDWPRARASYAPPPEGLAWWEAAARRDGRWPAATIARHEAVYGARYEPAKRARHALYFAHLLRRQGVEHVHVHFANRATHAALFIHELTGIPFSFTAHAQDFLVDLGSDALLGEMCARAAFVVAVSEWSRRALIEKCPSAGAKIHRVYNGLPLDRWPAPLPTALSSTGELRIFSVGRLIEFKGFADLIAACAKLRERGVPFRCEMAGDGPLREALEARIRSVPGLASCVRLTGLVTQEEVRARMIECDVFALACRVDEKGACDVLPTVILEAMAAGRPVVSTRLAGVPEMVADEKTGLLVPPGDPGALAEALIRLANEPELRTAFGLAGRARLTAEFSADESARQLGALLTNAKAAGDFSPAGAPPTATSLPTLCLLDRWPEPGAGVGIDDGALLDLRRDLPGLRYIALTAGRPPVADGLPDATLSLVAAFEFLPDALALETGWRVFVREAHRIESWRGVVGGGCTTEDFLLAARRALYLHQHLRLEPARPWHVHAVGPGAVLCAWLLVRLGAGTASFFLGRDAPLTGAALRRLAPAFVGGWIVGERKLTAAFGPGFRFDEPSSDDWMQAVKGWGDRQKAAS